MDDRIDPLEQKIDRLENNIDKVLKIVTRTEQELILTKSKVSNHGKRLTKVEKKLNLKPPASSVFA